ncbi:MAG: hypothetical protein DMF89_18965 [Acidobacteria bacterium]|jgi:hypothetical protein|nr:MAG: hypothetical protein DMF90_06420 [Acidobacteriota bacterium]PYR47404.1 MAG: hypothetical protein DMF89_18965 [Acidobacteriota bacterium]
MIITKLALPRRTFLRGIGAAVALPLLDAMVPALSAASRTAATPARRLGFVYIPNGAIMDQWTPVGDGKAFEFAPIMKSLDAHREQVVVVSNLASRPAEAAEGEGSGDHARASAVWLTGIHPKRTEGADVRGGKTIDQIAADELGRDTQLRSLEVAAEDFTAVGGCDIGYACSYVNTLSWRTPTTPLPMQTDPRVVFERLFGEGLGADQRRRQLSQDQSILDAIVGQVGSLRKQLGAADGARVSEYLDSVREVERRVQKMEARVGEHIDIPTMPVGVPDLYDDHVKLMYDLLALAFQADVTRVTTFMLAREASTRTYSHIGVPDPHHAISHHGNAPDKIEKHVKINAYHMSLFAYFLDRLRSTPDGDGTLLDHSLLLYGGCISNGNLHTHSPLPTLLAGGACGHLAGGRHLKVAAETPMSNLLCTILEKVDVPVERLGDSTGRVDL